ncbi:Vps54 protein [Candida orthopsilosis Co 90-125]|uniref:Vps54 protein n=1 Tax=Candida orthopsilosis (strain 90-125) TaxID=1136231 RepID=H8WXM4_CANO9|nr:Vps54 protein [Candida orthopsilosis Co 90-125]CCG21697.1 Vps54 protein [Candida orthopsilosis Co 90-125]
MADESSNNINVSSLDESVINLNDDLPMESSEHSFSSIDQPSSASTHQRLSHSHRRTGSLTSYRRSIDNESVVSLGTFFNADDKAAVYSPLGPNSIYELTVGSDQARSRKNRAPRNSVKLNGGTTLLSNLNTPTSQDIPQIQLERLKKKVSNRSIETRFVDDILDEYKKFEDSYKALTEESLRKLSKSNNSTVSAFSSAEQIDMSHSLSNVPEVFLDPDFKLDDPRTFKKVLENTNLKLEEDHIINDTGLQEKFSNYLDIVEINLISEIEKSSDSFFDAIGDIEKIQTKSEHCVQDFNKLMSKLDLLEKNQAKKGLKILESMLRKQNVEALERATIQLQYITTIFQLANISFRENNYFKCLNEIVATEIMIAGVEFENVEDPDIRRIYPHINVSNLSNVPALIHLRNDLQTLKTDCSKKFTDDFVELLLNDLKSHYENVPSRDTLNRMYSKMDTSRKYASRPINTSYLDLDDSLKQNLREYVGYLAKSGQLVNAYTVYQNQFIGEIKNIIKQNLPTQKPEEFSQTSTESSPAPNQIENKSNQLSANIKILTPKEFESMLAETFAQLSECLRRLSVHQKLLLDVALTSIPPTSDVNIMSLDITKAIHKAIELTQIRLMKVMNVRQEQITDLPLPLYLRLYSITSAYLNECEMINPAFEFTGAGNVLKEWFPNKLVYYIHRLHNNLSRSAAKSCMSETWKVTDDAKALQPAQTALNEVIGYTEFIQSSGEKGFSGSQWLSSMDFYDNGAPEAAQYKEGFSATKLDIYGDEFMVPNLAVVVSGHVKEYLAASKAFPNHSLTIESNLLIYFRDLNSRVSQAVLGAGATRTAGLKHITTKHLALCTRFIEFNVALLSVVQGGFKEAPEQNEQLTFKKMVADYKSHETELFAKVITIMEERTVLSCNKLPEINWAEPVKHPQQCHSYMESLVRDTLTVSKVLMRYLPEAKYSIILSRIFDNYKRLFVETYCTRLPPFKDFNEKHNVLRDVDYFRVKLSDISGYKNSGQVIWENVNSMPTEEDTKMDEVMRNNSTVETKREEPAVKSKNTFERLVSSARSSLERSPAPKQETSLEPTHSSNSIKEEDEEANATTSEEVQNQNNKKKFPDDSNVLFDAEVVDEEEAKEESPADISISKERVDSNTDKQVEAGGELEKEKNEVDDAKETDTAVERPEEDKDIEKAAEMDGTQKEAKAEESTINSKNMALTEHPNIEKTAKDIGDAPKDTSISKDSQETDTESQSTAVQDSSTKDYDAEAKKKQEFTTDEASSLTESVIANGSTKKSESTTSELRDLTNIALSNDVDSEPEPQEKRADDAEVIDEKKPEQRELNNDDQPAKDEKSVETVQEKDEPAKTGSTQKEPEKKEFEQESLKEADVISEDPPSKVDTNVDKADSEFTEEKKSATDLSTNKESDKTKLPNSKPMTEDKQSDKSSNKTKNQKKKNKKNKKKKN